MCSKEFSIENHLNDLRNSYRQIFLEVASDIESNIQKFDSESEVLRYLEDRFDKVKVQGTKDVLGARKDLLCVGCGVCCRFAVSEFSPDELDLKAKNGDKFALQFTQTFVPYNTIDEAKSVYPDYVDFLEAKGEAFYVYHCPKVTQDNRCPEYENRPQICKDFPDNPLAFLPPTCGFNNWKLKSEPVSLRLNAEAEIINFYKEKIKGN